MEVTRHRRSIAFFIALGVSSISILLVLYIGWILLNWRNGLLLFLGVLLVLMIICGIVLNTVFLVREIRRNEQHDAFINAVTHELKTPVTSIRLYLQTLQTRPVDEEKRMEFYRTMLDDSERLMATIEQVLRTGRLGAASRETHLTRVDLDDLVRSPPQMQRGPLPVAISADHRAVMPSQPTKQRRGGHGASGSPHSPGLFLIMPRPCVPAVAIAYRSVGLGGWLGARRWEPA